MTNRNLLADNLKESFGAAFVDARPFGNMAYLLGFRGKDTVEDFFAANKDSILDAFRKSGAAESISEPRPIDLEPGRICFLVYVHAA